MFHTQMKSCVWPEYCFQHLVQVTHLTFIETFTLVVKAVWALNTIWERGHDFQCCENFSSLGGRDDQGFSEG